jgi:hypothetical protein
VLPSPGLIEPRVGCHPSRCVPTDAGADAHDRRNRQLAYHNTRTVRTVSSTVASFRVVVGNPNTSTNANGKAPHGTNFWHHVCPNSQHPTEKGKRRGNQVQFLSEKLRSAASMWYNLDMQLCFPTQATRDQHRRCYLTVQTSPSDALAFTFLNTGMARRMGDSSQPSWTLGHNHIVYIDRQLELHFQSAASDESRHELATAACANLLAWLAWLRGGELFGITVPDLTITHPWQGATLGLPVGVGAILIRLAAETKSNPTRTADIIAAYTCGSPLSSVPLLSSLQCLQCDSLFRIGLRLDDGLWQFFIL